LADVKSLPNCRKGEVLLAGPLVRREKRSESLLKKKLDKSRDGYRIVIVADNVGNPVIREEVFKRRCL
jgi:hypothetical protein